MFLKWKWLNALFALILLAVVITGQRAAAESASPLDVQLIAGQDTVGVGGTLHAYILYHNTGKSAIANTTISVRIPDSLAVKDGAGISGGQWDAASGKLNWHVTGLQAGAAGSIPFALSVREGTADGTALQLQAAVTTSTDAAVTTTPVVTVTVGPHKDQPFFVGYPDGKFHPLSNLTRAETAAVVARIKGLKGDPSVPPPYSDVPKGNWAYGYILAVTQAGYMSGSDGKFRPDEPITRAELVTIVLKARGVREIPLPGFPDTLGGWSADILGTAKALQFIDGLDPDHFAPNVYIERQAAAKLLDIALARGPLVNGQTKVEQHFPDVTPEIWSFGWIEEASVVAHESVFNTQAQEALIRYLPDETNPM